MVTGRTELGDSGQVVGIVGGRHHQGDLAVVERPGQLERVVAVGVGVRLRQHRARRVAAGVGPVEPDDGAGVGRRDRADEVRLADVGDGVAHDSRVVAGSMLSVGTWVGPTVSMVNVSGLPSVEPSALVALASIVNVPSVGFWVGNWKRTHR